MDVVDIRRAELSGLDVLDTDATTRPSFGRRLWRSTWPKLIAVAVALARALAPNPRMLLMDEPFAALDAMTRETLYGDIQEIWQKRRKTILFVTHNVREAARLADRVLLLTSRPGRVAAEFEVDVPRPRRIDSREVSSLAATITDRLRAEVARHGRR